MEQGAGPAREELTRVRPHHRLGQETERGGHHDHEDGMRDLGEPLEPADPVLDRSLVGVHGPRRQDLDEELAPVEDREGAAEGHDHDEHGALPARDLR